MKKTFAILIPLGPRPVIGGTGNEVIFGMGY